MSRYDLVMGGDPDIRALMAASGLDDMEVADMMSSAGYPTAIMGDGQVNTQAIKQQLMANASVLTQQRAPTKAREYPIGFLSAGPIAAGVSQTVIAQPQVVFRGERLIVPSDIAGQFQIDDIRVGKNSQFADVNPIPARTFDEQSVGVRLRLDTAQISQQIALSVTNIAGAPATFRATLVGTAVE